MTQEALKLALEALYPIAHNTTDDPRGQADKAITAIKEALAQPEQEPVAWMDADGNVSDNNDHKCFPIPLYTSPPQQEPVIDQSAAIRIATVLGWTPPRPWVGLTEEEIKAFDTWHDNREEEVGWCNPSEIVAYIEAKLKEKNT